ncbi:MAG: GAF domain-containing protein [Bacteroidia bacterium]|nr:GAF domain-containing protein [Bacteroidia bacterium]
MYFLFRYIKINSFRQQINYNHIQESKFIQESQETVENKTLNFLLKELIPEHDNNKPVDKWADEILSKITKQIEVVQALLYIHKEKDSKKFVLTGKYAFYSDKGIEEIKEFTEGEGIIGRVAIKREPLITDQIPQKNIMVLSGLGSGPPRYMAVIPILYSDECIGIIQLFAFRSFDKNLSDSFIEIGNLIGEKLYSYLDYK